jgi:hypothetical protein
LISFLAWSFLGITYTATAIIAGVAGWISIVDSLKNEDKRNIIYGFILIIVSIIIRPESFIGATLIVIPFLFTRLKLNRTNVLKLAALAIAVSIIFIANYFLEKNQSLEIMDYRVWAKKVQMFAGRPRMEAAAKVIGESGWTPSQYNLFVDLAYFDPPYCDSHADYQGFYHLLETYTEYWKDKEFINGIKRYEPQRVSGFDKKRDVLDSFDKLFTLSEEIPHWLISYNNRSYPGIEEFEKLISKYRNVKVEAKTYQNGRGGKGSVAGSQEILFVCKPKKKHFVEVNNKK